MQKLIVGLLILSSLIFLIKKYYPSKVKKEKDCGSDCGCK
jgi:hypothetical protein